MLSLHLHMVSPAPKVLRLHHMDKARACSHNQPLTRHMGALPPRAQPMPSRGSTMLRRAIHPSRGDTTSNRDSTPARLQEGTLDSKAVSMVGAAPPYPSQGRATPRLPWASPLLPTVLLVQYPRHLHLQLPSMVLASSHTAPPLLSPNSMGPQVKLHSTEARGQHLSMVLRVRANRANSMAVRASPCKGFSHSSSHSSHSHSTAAAAAAAGAVSSVVARTRGMQARTLMEATMGPADYALAALLERSRKAQPQDAVLYTSQDNLAAFRDKREQEEQQEKEKAEKKAQREAQRQHNMEEKQRKAAEKAAERQRKAEEQRKEQQKNQRAAAHAQLQEQQLHRQRELEEQRRQHQHQQQAQELQEQQHQQHQQQQGPWACLHWGRRLPSCACCCCPMWRAQRSGAGTGRIGVQPQQRRCTGRQEWRHWRSVRARRHAWRAARAGSQSCAPQRGSGSRSGHHASPGSAQ
mmetsp:Transcript_19981/g.43550  ORF Transcript_19981/g.43550 Transcript_19981/m.43550 type:complete len:465 (+) Transcript_19981:448-1842(+)